MSELVDKALLEWLENEMSRISRDTTGSDWMPGTDYVLWQAVYHLPRDYRCGGHTIPAERLRRLGAVAKELGGWIKRAPDGQKRFVPWSEWNDLYAKWLRVSESQDEASEDQDGDKAIELVRRIAGLMAGKIQASSNAIELQGSMLSVSLEDSGDAYELLKALEDCQEFVIALDRSPPSERRGAWIEFGEDGKKVLRILQEPKDSYVLGSYVWCEELPKDR